MAAAESAAPSLAAFQVQDAAGKTYHLPDIKGKLTALHFWATWCVPCVEELPALDAVQEQYAAHGLKVVAVAEEAGGPEKAQRFLADHGITHLPLYLDPKGMALGAAKVKGLPATLFFDEKGVLLKRIDGPAAWEGEEMREFIEAALKK